MNISERTIPSFKGKIGIIYNADVTVGYDGWQDKNLSGCELIDYLNRKLKQIRYQIHLAQREGNSWALGILERMERETLTKLHEVAQ